jgi:hypothetical protein
LIIAVQYNKGFEAPEPLYLYRYLRDTVKSMRRTMVSVPDDVWKKIQDEVKKGKWQNMADGIRYYLRRGAETDESR